MPLKTPASALVLSLLVSLAASQQQAILQDGNGQLPACAQSCAKLIQASQACSGTNSASQTAWICFCQSGYLTTLRQSAIGICSTSCTSQADLAQISTWYSRNCGSDNGASEHAGGGSDTASSSAAAAAPSSTGGAGGSSGSDSGDDSSDGSQPAEQGDWWSQHYQWIVMVIVLAILLPLIGVLGHWLRRRHELRRDQTRNGFNAGITSRTGPMGNPDHNMSGAVSSPNLEGGGGGRDTPARTRDAFMPYGYGYSRSESGLATHDDRRSPVSGRETMDTEKEAANEASKGKPRRVLVRERSGQDSIEAEKPSRY